MRELWRSIFFHRSIFLISRKKVIGNISMIKLFTDYEFINFFLYSNKFKFCPLQGFLALQKCSWRKQSRKGSKPNTTILAKH